MGTKYRKHFFSSIIRNRHTFTLLFRDLQKKVYSNLDKALLTLKIAETDSSGAISVMSDDNNPKSDNESSKAIIAFKVKLNKVWYFRRYFSHKSGKTDLLNNTNNTHRK